MKTFQAEIVRRQAQTVFGVQKTSGDKRQRTDVPMMIRLYARLTGKDPAALLPLYAVSWGFDKPGVFTLFVGGSAEADGLNELRLPAGEWLRVEIRPFLSHFWSGNLHKARQWFYGCWLAQNGYEAMGLECEVRTENKGVRELLFSIRKRGK